jgi:catechol 2,3-dioxygenase-like lactoylglutathione lyase family enzyme
MIKGVSNIWMPVQDTDRAVDFYENILGFPVVKRDGAWAEVDANGLIVGLNGREPEGTLSEGGPVLTFQPEGSLEAAVDDLKERGVYFPAEISEHDWGRVATLAAILVARPTRVVANVSPNPKTPASCSETSPTAVDSWRRTWPSVGSCW